MSYYVSKLKDAGTEILVKDYDLNRRLSNIQKQGLTALKLIQGTSVKISCIGDSLTYGYDAAADAQTTKNYPRLFKQFVDVYGSSTVVNLGVAGDTTSEMVARLSDIATDSNMAIMMGGTNDINHDINTNVIIDNFIKFIDYCVDNGITPVIASPPTLLRPDDARREKYASLVVALKNLASAYGIIYVPVYEYTTRAVSDNSLNITIITDGTHFTDYNTVASIMFATIFPSLVSFVEPEKLTEGYRAPNTITNASLVTPNTDVCATDKSLHIDGDEIYKTVLFFDQKIKLYLVGDAIESSGQLNFTLGNKNYGISCNSMASSSHSDIAYIDIFNAGCYIMNVTSVTAGHSTVEYPRFYLQGFYAKSFIRALNADDVFVKTYTQSVTLTAGGTLNASFTLDVFPGSKAVMGQVSSGLTGVAVGSVSIDSDTTCTVKLNSIRSTDTTGDMTITVMYIRK